MIDHKGQISCLMVMMFDMIRPWKQWPASEQRFVRRWSVCAAESHKIIHLLSG